MTNPLDVAERGHEFWISLGRSDHERLLARVGGSLPLALKRAHGKLEFWARRLADTQEWLRDALNAGTETPAALDRVTRLKVDYTYYAEGEHEARQHLARVERQAAEHTPGRRHPWRIADCRGWFLRLNPIISAEDVTMKMTRYSASGHVATGAALLEDDHERGGSDTRARVAAELREVVTYLDDDGESAKMRAALKLVREIMAFYEGGEKPIREGGEPVIWINASSVGADFQKMLAAVRDALRRT